MISTTTAFRLPGVYFLPQSSDTTRGLPPLDVAAFVGFAERGPLHLPVPIDDMHMYQSIFGGDFALAREIDGGADIPSDPTPGTTPLTHDVKGRTVFANLSRSVAMFFANGGRRCYVVRVAGKAATATRFRVPGIVALKHDGTAKPVFVRASSAGRWSASLRLFTRFNLTPLPRNKFTLQDTHRITWETGSAPLAIQAGDLLRLTLTNREKWLFPVTDIEHKTTTVVLKAKAVWQLLEVAATSPPIDADLSSITTENLIPVEPESPPPSLQLNSVERIRFDLLIDDSAGQHRINLQELAFNVPHPRFWGMAIGLESGSFRQQSSFDGTFKQEFQNAINSTKTSFENPNATLATRVAQLYNELQTDKRIETASDGNINPLMLTGLLAPFTEDDQSITYLPLGMPLTYSEPISPQQNDIGQDDLETFEPSLFLDEYLVPAPHNIATGVANSLMTTAIDRYYRQNRRLYGLHSLTFINEVALISLPDANHRGWQSGKEIERQVHDANANQPNVPTKTFVDCLAAPNVQTIEPSWGPVTGGTQVIVTGSGFTLETSISFAGNRGLEVQVLDSTQLQCITPVAGNAGPVTVEVKTKYGSGINVNAFAYQWSATNPSLPEITRVNEFKLDSVLLPVHQALINFCQARSDAVGILSLPAHFEKRQCIEWQERLRDQLGLPRRRIRFTDLHDVADLSYAAVYHPWLLVRDTTTHDGLRTVSPDGAVCGMIAARENKRQVWVAPANIPIHGILGLKPNFSEDGATDLFAAQFNLIREEVDGLHVMSAHTLSDERSLLQLSVRRLLIQLRKAAVEKGMDYVFARNHEYTRNAIRISLENLLRFMFERGAFVGATEPSAFRIITDNSVNSSQSIEQGQLIAQIQVAPSEPLEFITIQLIRTGEDLLHTMEV